MIYDNPEQPITNELGKTVSIGVKEYLDKKEAACGCAGCYSAATALPLYATAFDSVGKIDKLEGFASRFGAQFYGLPINDSTITLVNTPMQVPAVYPYFDGSSLTPLMAGETLPWSIKA